MRGRSYSASPPRDSGRRRRSPSPRGRYGGDGGKGLRTSLWVRNLHDDCSRDDLATPFEQFGRLRDIHIPRHYRTGQPRRFGFVEFFDPGHAAEAQRQMDGTVLLGRELTVAFAERGRLKPSEMKARDRGRWRSRFNDRRRSLPRYSRSPRSSHSPPPRRGRSPPRRSRDYYSPSPKRHHSRSVSPRDERRERGRSYSHSPASSGSQSPVRGRSQSPRRNRSQSQRRSRRYSSRQPRGRRRNRSQSRRRSRSYSPRQPRGPRRNRSQSPRCREHSRDRIGDGSPSQ